ncbi:MAG: GNAT family N-acetyltransferase [Clostridia bacterium]|nr:GNAT family N-acetyltransferase [Clostridia bacterium]
MLIREAVFDDIANILELYTDIGDSEEITAEKIAHIWDRIKSYPYYKMLVAELDGTIIGTYCIIVIDNLGHGGKPLAVVESVVVHPYYRSKGIGRQLMQDAMKRAREQGCYKLMLSSNKKRVRAHRFYEELGFEQHGISFMVEVKDHE